MSFSILNFRGKATKKKFKSKSIAEFLSKTGNNVDAMYQENSKQVYGNRITERLGCKNATGI